MNKQEVATLVGVLAAGFPQWQVTKETVVSNGGTAVSMAHSPPVQAQSNNTIQGTAQSITNPLNNEPIWQNTTGKALTVTVS